MKSLESKKANPRNVLAARLAAMVLSVCIVSGSSPARAAIAPLCGSDPTCTPDSGSGAYAGAVVARAKVSNARGFSSPTVAKASLGATAASAARGVTVIGSQSYNYVIPILRLPGRAGMDFALNLYYNSRIWDVDTLGHTITFNADRDFPSYGFRLDFGYLEQSAGSWILTEGDGTKEILPSTDGTNVVFTSDNVSSTVVTYPTGTQVQYQPFPSNSSLWRPVTIKDSNGNYFSVSYVSGRDQAISQISGSLGRVITFNYDASNRLASLTQPVHPSGTRTLATFTWGSPYPSGYSWYSFSGLTVNGAPTAAQVEVLTGCTYPNGTGYRFTYGDWGIISKIESLSSTGLARNSVSYDFPLASQGALTDAPSFAHQTISPDGGTADNSVWTYATTKNGTGVVTSLAVTDPNGTVSTTNLAPATGLTSSVQVKDSANNVLRTVNCTWITGPVTGATLPGTIATTNDAGQQSSVQYAYDGNHFDQVTDIYEYDFGAQLKRHTVTEYLNGPNLNLHILNLPSQVLVKDGAGNTVSRTDLAYDGTSLPAVTGAANHDDASYPASFTNRGLLTAVTRYANAAAGTGATTRSFFHDSLGNLISAQLDCCNQETSSFSSATQYSFPDSITRGPGSSPQFTTSYTYDPDTSLLLTSTDENGQLTQIQYDAMNRPTQVTSPQGGTQVHVTTAYGDDTLAPTITRSSNANSLVSVTTLDGLGHVTQVDTQNGGTLVSSVKLGYDKLWRRTTASNPFAPAETPVFTTFSYDALGRVIRETPPSAGFTQYAYTGNAVTITDAAGKQRKNIADALGRLIEVDEPGETFAGTAAGGTLTIGGTLLSQSGVGAAPGTGTVTFGGPGSQAVCCDGNGSLIWDQGQVWVTVNNSTQDLIPFAGGSPAVPFMIAQYMTLTINQDNPLVTASLNGSVITLTAKTVGVGTNYPISASSTYDSTDFSQPSFTATPSGPALTGGNNGVTVLDSGTVTVTVGSTGFTASAPYGQASNSTAAQVATALAGTGPTGLNRSGSPVTATVSGASLTLTYKTPGSAGNLTVTAVSTSSNTSLFPAGSFSGSRTLTGGQDAYASGLAHPYAATYTYDVLDDLTGAVQAAGNVSGQPASGQPRGYTYDSLGRQLTATTPESGLVTTFYTTASGGACAGDLSLPCRIQDARGIVKSLTYDGINRLTGVQYSDGTPAVTYTYDTGGAAAFALDRLTKIAEGPTNSRTFMYDNFGRVTSVSQVVDSTTYVIRYAYNLAGQLTSITYPSGRVVTQNADAIGRLSSIVSGTTTYLNGLSYNAAGETLGLTLGNGVQGTFTYNDHLQMASLRYSKSSVSPDVLNLGFDYGTGNNGQIQAVHYNTSQGVEDATKSEYFSYDPWLRLSSAHTGVVNTTAGTWSLAWGYDRFGNRLNQTLTGGNVTVTQPQLAVDPATNRVLSNSYDAAGNMTGDGVSTYSYDGTNRLKQINAGSATYTYFGASRIKKVVGITTTVYVYSGSRPIAEYANGSLSKEYVYVGSRLLATLAGSSTTYHHPDQLSNRVETDSAGNVLRRFGHFPFGETWYETGTADKWKFTTYERDSGSGETGLDYARIRYYSSVQGRFLSADAMGGARGVPQSLNRYAYVMNDPINLADPSGLTPQCVFNVVGGSDLPQSAKDEINRILGQAGVGATFNDNGSADATLVQNATDKQTDDGYGKTPPGGTISYINNALITAAFNEMPQGRPPAGYARPDLNLGFGRVVAHELAHGLGQDDVTDPKNLMGLHGDNETFGKTTGANFGLTDTQKAALLQKCKDLAKGHGGGLGGVSVYPLPPDFSGLLLGLIADPAAEPGDDPEEEGDDGLTPVVTHRILYE